MNSTQSTFGLTRQTFESEAPLNTMEKGGGFFDNTFKFANYRKRRLSKVPSVIIPPPSIIIAPVSPPSSSSSKSDSYFEQPSPKTPSSPKRFVLKPITALTAAFQKTTITGRNKSSTMNLLKFQKSPKSPKPVSSPQSPKPPKLLHRKGSSGSIRKRSESPTTTSSTATTVILPPSQTPTNNKLKTKLGGGKFKTPKSCRKALPIVPSELAERLRESCSFSAKFEQVNAYNNYHCQPFLNKLFQPILIDVRNLSLYQDEHIRDSFNVNLPTLLIKRFRRGTMNNFSLDSFITTPEGRDKYLDIINDNGDKFQHDIIIFDDNMDENDKVSPGWTLLNVLELNYYHSNLSTDSIDEINELPKGRVYWLKGGFEAFKSWDQRGEFIVTDNDNNNNNENNDKMECEDKEQQGSNLIRRDSLFSVNTERSSFRRKKSIKNPELVEQSSQLQQQQQQPQPQQQEQLLPLQLQQNHEQKQLPQLQLQSEFSRVRRPSNGLQYLFTPTNNKLGDSLTLYPTASYGVHDFPDSDEIPDTPIVSHPEAAFVVSTIIPGFLFLGPEITKQEEVKELKDKGVKRVLNMAFECDDSFKEEFDRYLKLNVKDSVEEDVENGLKIAVGFIERAQKDNTPIYVHCKAGKSRSVTAVLAYLIKSRQWTLKYAYDYVMERRSGISPNIGFVAELMRIEESVFGFKRNGGVLTEVDFRNKGEIMDMEGVESLSKTPKTAFF